jgi:hypothetical protein
VSAFSGFANTSWLSVGTRSSHEAVPSSFHPISQGPVIPRRTSYENGQVQREEAAGYPPDRRELGDDRVKQFRDECEKDHAERC